MTYYAGTVAAVPTKNRQIYIDHVHEAWPVFQRYGCTRMVEGWGVDIPKGKVTDFYKAVDAREDETIVFAWTEWPDKQAADAAWERMQAENAMMQISEMPFDGSRMIYGGFSPVFTAGSDQTAGYIQGFALAVPERNREAYIRMASEAWESAFAPNKCLGVVEAWGVDVPHGTKTDFYRATKAEDNEVPLFSWTAWADRETCDAATKAMEASMEGQEFPEMPFDGMRMFWGGFQVIFDSARL